MKTEDLQIRITAILAEEKEAKEKMKNLLMLLSDILRSEISWSDKLERKKEVLSAVNELIIITLKKIREEGKEVIKNSQQEETISKIINELKTVINGDYLFFNHYDKHKIFSLFHDVDLWILRTDKRKDLSRK
jgi:hypothetical protein